MSEHPRFMEVHFLEGSGPPVVRQVEITDWISGATVTVPGGQIVKRSDTPNWPRILPDYDIREPVGQVLAIRRLLA